MLNELTSKNYFDQIEIDNFYSRIEKIPKYAKRIVTDSYHLIENHLNKVDPFVETLLSYPVLLGGLGSIWFYGTYINPHADLNVLTAIAVIPTALYAFMFNHGESREEKRRNTYIGKE